MNFSEGLVVKQKIDSKNLLNSMQIEIEMSKGSNSSDRIQ